MSKYNVSFAMGATLTESVVKEMIRKVVEDETGLKVKQIHFKIREVDCGDCREPVMIPALESCEVSFVQKLPEAGNYDR